jgi:hypothetical protein
VQQPVQAEPSMSDHENDKPQQVPVYLSVFDWHRLLGCPGRWQCPYTRRSPLPCQTSQ